MSKYIVDSEELSEIYEWAMNEENDGETRYSGMSYEDGIKAMVDWIEGDERPDM